MHATCGRLTEQWEPLKAYFNSEPTDYIMENGKKKRVDENIRTLELRLRKSGLRSILKDCSYLLYSSKMISQGLFILKCFFSQTASRVACLMKHKMDTLLKDVLMCYVKHNVINSFSDVQT